MEGTRCQLDLRLFVILNGFTPRVAICAARDIAATFIVTSPNLGRSESEDSTEGGGGFRGLDANVNEGTRILIAPSDKTGAALLADEV